MAKQSRRLTESIQEMLRSWGIALSTSRKGGSRKVLKTFLTLENGKRILVGELWQDDTEFVYEYSEEFKAIRELEPIPGFQDLEEEYRSEHLWPFFQARIPPLGRKDVAEVLERRGVDTNDTLRVLSAVSSRSIANPYEFELSRR